MLLLALWLTACDSGKVETGPVDDADGDGVSAPYDCDDDDAAVHPGAAEACDGWDQDCDGEVDEGVLVTFWTDGDG
ncbi:MAG: putative metal-binding motif-containing protein, partial [Myxococcota bacterium]